MQTLRASFPVGNRVLLSAALLTMVVSSAAGGSGNYLIITAEGYAGSAPLTEFADAKTAMGFDVSTYTVPSGTSRTVIKDYILSLWGTPDAPDYILLVGDTDGSSSGTFTIPHWSGGGSKQAPTDLPYGCMDPGDDWYPDIAVGRFSVRSISALQIVVDKSLFVEAGNFPDPDYVKRAAFLANPSTNGMAEPTHDWVIENLLEPNDYIGVRVYSSQGAGTQDVTNAVNNGCLWIGYYGHSGSTGWWDPSFNQSNVQNLSNAGLYGVAWSFSCNVGNYTISECFGETWLRVANKGAAAVIFPSSYIYWGSPSAWEPSTVLEHAFFKAFFEDDIWEVGPAWQAGLYRFLVEFGGSTDIKRNFFELYNLMGDPALRLPGSCSDAGTITLDSAWYACESSADILVNDCGLDTNSGVVETVEITIDSDSEPDGETVLLTETGPGTAEFAGSIDLSATNTPGVLLVAHDDTVTATYIDADNGQGGFNIEVTDTATIDCVGPAISNVTALNIGSSMADVTFDGNEPVRGTVYYGLNCGALEFQVSLNTYETSPLLHLPDLVQSTEYYYAVEAEDQTGNTTYDDNGGLCYSFETAEGPQAIYSFPFDSDPGWSTQGQWAFGQPTGQGGTQFGLPDPTAGATGVNVYGVNLNGDYSTTPGGPYNLTVGPLDLTNVAEVSLRFQRWLNTDYQPFVYATIEVSNNVGQWTEIWGNGSGEITANSWSEYEYDISAIANNQSDVYIRWGYEIGSGAWAYSGWNIDDVEIWGVAPGGLLGDLNCDEVVNAFDIDPFVLALTDPAGYAVAWPDCDIMNGDCNGDGVVNAFDIDPFVELLTGG